MPETTTRPASKPAAARTYKAAPATLTPKEAVLELLREVESGREELTD